MNPLLPQRCIIGIAATMLLAPLSVAAQEDQGLYASAYGGASAAPSTSFSETRSSAQDVGGKVSFGSGIGFGAAVGHRFGNGWAIELAWDERGNFLKRVGGVKVDGNVFSSVVFLNGYYRFPARGVVRPFFGAGLGRVLALDIDIDRDGKEQEYSRESGVAFQVIAGGEYTLSSRWSLSGDVRWSRISSGTFEPTTAGTALIGKPRYQPFSLNLSFGYRF
ncbi:MAG: porin family protein [Burkholderiales bacterium]|nr:porin family protein [Burkholderiales bacterium]